MKERLSEIGLDSQCLSYLIDALEGIGPPTDSLADQKVALVRLYLYTPGTLWVTPTVQTEFLRIRDARRRGKHESWTSVLFGVRPVANSAAVDQRAAEMLTAHGDADDCRILAEAEDIGLQTLVTFDDDLVKHLSSRTSTVCLTRPATLWAELDIPRGAPPIKMPSLGNPLANQAWWRW